MKPFETLESVETPDGHRLTLHKRDGDFFIDLDGEELMSSRVHESEAALAELACRNLKDRNRPHVLIGGLGLGFTLRAALAVLPRKSIVTVAEIFPAVVEWNRRYLAEPGRPLTDPRVQIRKQDVATLLGDEFPDRYDAILLDVDNGPSTWCLKANRRLYEKETLERIRTSLTPRGVLGVWSAQQDPAFAKRLRKRGFKVTVQTIRSRGRRGIRHTIFLAS